MDKKYYFLEGDFICCVKCEDEENSRTLRIFLNGVSQLSDIKAYVVEKNGAYEEEFLTPEDKNTYCSRNFSKDKELSTIVIMAVDPLTGEEYFSYSGREKDLKKIKNALKKKEEKEKTSEETLTEKVSAQVPEYLNGKEETPEKISADSMKSGFEGYGISFKAKDFEEENISEFPYSFLFLSKNPVSSVVRMGGFLEGQKGDVKILGFLFSPEKDPFPLLHLATKCMVKISSIDESIACCFIGADMKKGKLTPVDF